MEEISELRQEIKRLTQTVSVLEQQLAQYETDGPNRFVYELNRWVVNATNFIKEKSTNIATLVSGEGKDFERMMVLIKSTKENVESIAALKQMLNIKPASDDSGESTPRTPFIDSIADKRN